MLTLTILEQPDDQTCGPTSLHAVYQYFNYNIELAQLIRDIHFLEEGGTLAVYLGIDALKRGFNATLYSYNLKIFDPSWDGLEPPELIAKLRKQLRYKKGKKFTEATKAYIRFLKMGGIIKFDNLTYGLLTSILQQNIPVLAGLSATYLYKSKREFIDHKDRTKLDDIKGEPVGHFVVLGGIKDKKVMVADPYKQNPFSNDHIYEVSKTRFINAILLGIVTYDANLLIVSPKI